MLPPIPLEERDPVRLPEELLARREAMGGKSRESMGESAVEAATQVIYTEVLRGQEKQRCMIQAHLVQSVT